MKHGFLTNTIIALAVVFACSVESMGGIFGSKNDTKDIFDMTLDENLECPEITNETHAQRIVEYQEEVAQQLVKKKYLVETMRNGEIVIVTITADKLFEPNDTVLASRGKSALKPLLEYLKNPGFYKMLLVMHSDDTGSEAYTINLTRNRINSVCDWMEQNANMDFVVPYAMGSTDPLEDNDSMEKRRNNRRLEIFLVPEEGMIAQAKKGKVNINKKIKK
ncbi:MAG: OmpA family protein [Muribaculaceae bacterium]|nr:OmpA family protein [Muribaculaceae bacterium]